MVHCRRNMLRGRRNMDILENKESLFQSLCSQKKTPTNEPVNKDLHVSHKPDKDRQSL